MSEIQKQIDALDEEFERLNAMFTSMIHEGLLTDIGRCDIKDTIADAFSEAASLAAEDGGYEDDGEIDILCFPYHDIVSVKPNIARSSAI
jgi:hypothetical protein